MLLTRLLAATIVGLLAAHPSPSQDAQSDPDRTVAGGTVPAGGRAPRDRGRPRGVRPAALDIPGLVGYAVHHTLDAHIGALAAHRQ